MIIMMMVAGGMCLTGAAEPITLYTNMQWGHTDAGNGYSGIGFTLRYVCDRYSGAYRLQAGAEYELTSMDIQWRNDDGLSKIGNKVHIVLTDPDLRIVGVSSTSAVVGVQEIPGTQITKISMVRNVFEQPVSLTMETPYLALYVEAQNITAVMGRERLDPALLGSVNLMAWGGAGTYGSPVEDWGLLKGTATDAPDHAPVAYLSLRERNEVPGDGSGSVPEPSAVLLGLFGLCMAGARRRR